ncbi:Mmgt [Acrasis kona]|uniref:Mmgt n=1 Tax=Acrasis kona TaxID=1008807 RepID=A0AAW2Z612_9EUKA
MGLWTPLVYLGLVLLIHSLISAVQFISTHGPISLPADIAFECIIGCLISAFSYVKMTAEGEWKQISIAKAYSNLTWGRVENRPSFAHFNHRAKSIFSDKAPNNNRK